MCIRDRLWGNSQSVALIRLNSIYDPIRNAHTGTEFPIYATNRAGGANTVAKLLDPTAATSTSSITQGTVNNVNTRPQGRDIWAAHFKYYRVLRSDVKVTWVNSFCAPNTFKTTPVGVCLLYTSPSPRDRTRSRMPSSA